MSSFLGTHACDGERIAMAKICEQKVSTVVYYLCSGVSGAWGEGGSVDQGRWEGRGGGVEAVIVGTSRYDKRDLLSRLAAVIVFDARQ